MLRTAPCHTYHIQTAVIGAGVIGLAVARALSKKGHEVLLLEQADAIGSGVSSRNSEVIHAGIYYDRSIMPLKSRFCVEGKKLMYQYCNERDIPYSNCGKLLVATDAEQRDVGLPQLVEYARRNGVGDDLQIVTKEDIADPYSNVYEPNVHCTGGVFSPSTGIVDSHIFMTSLLADAEENGATLALHCKVEGGRAARATSEENIVLDVDGDEIACDNVVICAGLATDKIASSIVSGESSEGPSSIVSGEPSEEQSRDRIPRQYYAKGNYFQLQNQKSPFNKLIYPLPDPKGGLGVHATIDLAGSTKFGPDVQWLDNATGDPEKVDMNVDPARAESFYNAVRKYWPELQDGNLVPDYSGIRPKLVHPEVNVVANELKDYIIAGPERHGVDGLTVLLGIESPGLTSSLAIGRYVADSIG
ncbi:hypothetical protein ACHAXT_009994 [Thalassiosira profunda]